MEIPNVSVPPEVQRPPPPPLPKAVLLKVFEYLTVPELLAARTVCRRWAALALHRNVWWRREVSDAEIAERGVFKAALRLAPCVTRISITSSLRTPPGRPGLAGRSAFEDCGVLVATTRCAAKYLSILVHDGDALTAALVLRNQASLGRLRGLQVTLMADGGQDGDGVDRPSERSRQLVWEVGVTAGLDWLVFTVQADYPLPARWLPPEWPTTPSLRTLLCRFANMSWCLVMQHLIGRHAATLQAVHLSSTANWSPRGAFNRRPWAGWVVARVGGGLRELYCPLLQEMTSLARCDRLHTLKLWLDKSAISDHATLAEAKQYLRTAIQLQKLIIYLNSEVLGVTVDLAAALAPAVGLVEAVASSRRSALRGLDFDLPLVRPTVDGALLHRLAAAVGQLGALREVRVVVGDRESFLRVVGYVSGAAGRRPLTLGFRFWVRQDCVHAWVHHGALQLRAIFEGRSSLHVELDGTGYRGNSFFYCNGPACPACVLRCHGHGARPRVVLYGHPENAACDSPLHADRDAACHRIGYGHGQSA